MLISLLIELHFLNDCLLWWLPTQALQTNVWKLFMQSFNMTNFTVTAIYHMKPFSLKASALISAVTLSWSDYSWTLHKRICLLWWCRFDCTVFWETAADGTLERRPETSSRLCEAPLKCCHLTFWRFCLWPAYLSHLSAALWCQNLHFMSWTILSDLNYSLLNQIKPNLDQPWLFVLVNVGEISMRFRVCLKSSVPKVHWCELESRGEQWKTMLNAMLKVSQSCNCA